MKLSFRVMALAMLLIGAPVLAQDNQTAPLDEIRTRLQRLEEISAQRLNEAEAARQEADKARSKAEAARKRAQDLASAARAATQATAAAQAAAEKAAMEAEAEAGRLKKASSDAAGKAAAARSAADKAAKERKALQGEYGKLREQFQVALAGGGIAILLVLGAVYFFWRRAKKLKGDVIDAVAHGVLLSRELNLQLPGSQLPLKAGGVVLGRNPEFATAVLSKNDVSRRHARFYHDDGSYWVEDLGSKHGTKVDDQALVEGQALRIAPGTMISFAGYEFSFDVPK